MAANRRTEKPVIHISLNPHPDDVLTDEQLTAIGQEYMEKMGYGNQPYIIYRHEDIGRPHIHIVSLRIDEQGKKIKDYKEWQRSTAVCRELERKYHLLPAEKMERRESLPLTAVDYRKGDIKHQIGVMLDGMLSLQRYVMDASGNTVPKDAENTIYRKSTTETCVTARTPNADIDQSGGYAGFGLLYVTVVGGYDQAVSLRFNHRMAKVEFTLMAGEGVTEEKRMK
nr:relaxase/mobilization nuclease domain-containing protein [Parabacteroides goldsteinii]